MSISTLLDIPELPVVFMNDDHALAVDQWAEMVAGLNVYATQPDRLLSACQEFLRHSREHFAREETAMRAAGFPPYPVHKQEHDRVLAWLQGLVDSIQAGERASLLEDVIKRDVATWLQQHVQTMDLVTARWIAAHS